MVASASIARADQQMKEVCALCAVLAMPVVASVHLTKLIIVRIVQSPARVVSKPAAD